LLINLYNKFKKINNKSNTIIISVFFALNSNYLTSYKNIILQNITKFVKKLKNLLKYTLKREHFIRNKIYYISCYIYEIYTIFFKKIYRA